MLPEPVIQKYKNNAQGLAEFFSEQYFREHEKRFPINPFQVLTDLGIHFVFRNFDKIEGLYMPATEGDQLELVIINANRLIQRQRFSAAHELCHFLKDRKQNSDSIICASKSKKNIERYADAFAAAFLMPRDELYRQIEERGRSGKLEWDDVLVIAEYFGTSFQACFFRIKELFPLMVADKLPKYGEKGYQPSKRREELGLNNVQLLSDLLDAWNDMGLGYHSEFALAVFQNQYIYNDSRLEGVESDLEAVAEIVSDLENNEQNSNYCSEEYKAFCQIAGHKRMYDYIFEKYGAEGFTLYETMALHRKLFSYAPYPDLAGKFRDSNVLVLGAKFETLDFREIARAMADLSRECLEIEKDAVKMSRSELIKRLVRVHHKITVIHPFGDGNGRTSRGYLNESLMRYGFVPFYIKLERKKAYLNALAKADKLGDYSKLYEFVMKALIESSANLALQF